MKISEIFPFAFYPSSYFMTDKDTVTGTGHHKSFKTDLPTWIIGKHKIHAKNPKDALKYIKKRGLWDGKSYPMRII